MRSVYVPMTVRMFQADGSQIVAIRQGVSETSVYFAEGLPGPPAILPSGHGWFFNDGE
jgi:hypothetical protein